MIVCTLCQGPLEDLASSLSCSDCGVTYPVRNAVPLMTPPSQTVSRIARLKDLLNIHHVDDEAIGEAMMCATGYFYDRPGLEQEFANIVGRFPGIETRADQNPGEVRQRGPSRLAAVTEMLGAEFLPGERTSRSIRLRNDTPAETFATIAPNPHHLSYHIYDEAGGLVEFEGARSAFPIELPPGAELTVPLQIQAPQAPGRYRLDVLSLQEGVLWHDEAPIMSVPIVVDAGAARVSPAAGLDGEFDYQTDFATSVDVTRQGVANVAQPEILEVACGLYPVSASLLGEGVKLTAVDLCWPELQLSSLIYNHHDKSAVRFVCADVEALPFKPGSFDAVVICAALHHFPDPTFALSSLRRYLKPGGALVLLREPSLVNIADVNYLADLRRGFNEQQFQLEEYGVMLDRAGFAIEQSRVDYGGSLKLVARPN